MLLVDDILFFPAKSLMWIFRQIHEAVQEELESEADSITSRLREIYMMLETGQMTEEEFETQEAELLNRLDEIENNEEEEDEEEEEEKEEEIEK